MYEALSHPAHDPGALLEDPVQLAMARPVLDFVEAINRGDLDGAVDQLAPTALHHGRISNYTPAGVRVLFVALRDLLPDLQFDVRDMRVDGCRVLTRLAATGTHTGSYLGKPPTGMPLAWESFDVAEIGFIDDGAEAQRRIMKRFWDVWSDPSLWDQLGFIPAIMC